MEKIKEKVSNWLTGFKDHINSFNIIEKYKNVVYFSKFTLESDELFEIHNFILTLKKNLFLSLYDQFKYSIYNIMSFEDKNLSEKDKILSLFSACFLNYYKKFLYETSHDFKEFYDQSFFNLVKTFKIKINNYDIFKVLCFCFFDKMKSEIINLNYDTKVKPLKHTYNSEIKNKNNIDIINSNNNINNISNNIIKVINESNDKMKVEETCVKKKAINFVVSAKEKTVDIIYELKYRKILPSISPNARNEINNMNLRLNQLNNMSVSALDDLFKIIEKEKIEFDNYEDDINMSTEFTDNFNNSINININQFFDKTEEISNTDSFKNNMDLIKIINNKNKNSNDIKNFNINNNNNNSNSINIINESKSINNQNTINEIKINKTPLNLINNTLFTNQNQNQNKSVFKPINISLKKDNMYSHRLTEELAKNKIDGKTKEIIEKVAKKIDEQYLDFLLQNSPKPLLSMEYFLCYVATFDPNLLQNISPEYKDILKNVHIKFIILAKQFYNTAMELFCSIYDLTSTNVNRFLDLIKNYGIHMKYAQGLQRLFMDYSMILLEKNALSEIRKTVEKFVEMERLNWEKIISKGSDIISPFFKE